MPINRGHWFRDVWTMVLAKIDAMIAEVEPLANQPLGSVEQRRATIELAALRADCSKAAKDLKRAIEGLKPTK